MTYERDTYMRRQEAEHDMIRMREPRAMRQFSEHPDPRDEIIADLAKAIEGLLISHRPGRGQCCAAADAALDVLARARGDQ